MLETHYIKSIATIDVLRDFQRYFSRLTGLSLTYINLNADFITDDRGSREFCLILNERENAAWGNRCWDSNFAACQKVFKTKKTLIYQCRAGLTEIIAPIIINDTMIGAVMTGQIRTTGAGRFTVKRFTGFDKAMQERLAKAYRRVPELSEEQVQACADLLSLVTNYVFQVEHVQSSPEASKHSTYIHEIIEKALAFIREHYREPALSLNHVAEEVHLSPFYFSHIFKKTLHTTFIDYLTRVRLEETIRLLKAYPEKSIKEIAFQTGYEDPYYFSKVFRKVFKLSPLGYRQKFL